MTADQKAIYEFNRNLVVQAGAGTGKTYNLVKLYVHLLAGLTSRPMRFAPEDIVCVTFTDKAAQEMKGRIREKIAELREQPDCDEDLNHAAKALGRNLPDENHWDQMRLQMSSAFVGTFHGYCAQLLREHAVAAGLDPRFRLMAAAGESSELLEEVCRSAVLSETKHDGQSWEAVYRYQLTQQGPFGGQGVVEHVANLYQNLRETGLDSAAFEGKNYTNAHIHAAYNRALQAYTQDLQELVDGKDYFKVKSKVHERLCKLDVFLQEQKTALENIDLEDFRPEHPLIGRIAQIMNRAVLKDLKPTWEHAKGQLKEAERWAACIEAQPVIKSFQYLVDSAGQSYEQQKSELGALDFQDLILLTRNLLRDNPELRQKAKMRLRILMVDEFQDTNIIQKELVYLLGERRDQQVAIDKSQPLQKQLTLESSTLFIVGDRKQSIYGFRGADVSVFNQTLGEISGGKLDGEKSSRPLTLKTCRRTVPSLISATNLMFSHIMGSNDPTQVTQNFDSPFEADLDALTAFRQSISEEANLGLLSFTEAPEGEKTPKAATGDEGIRQQAKALVLQIQEMVQGNQYQVREKTPNDDGPLRAIRYGDIAILLRRFSKLQQFLRELILKGIPHGVVRGQGFYGAQEVQDMVNFLRLITDPRADVPLLATLRSPLVNLSDVSLTALALHQNRQPKLRLDRLLLLAKATKPFNNVKGLNEGDKKRLIEFLQNYKRLRSQADRLGAYGLSKAIVDVTHFDAALAGSFQGDQKVANLEKFLLMAQEFDQDAAGGLPSFVRKATRALEEQPKEANASLFGESEDVVQVMTIHQSKGLEFPVVFVPECHARPPASRSPVLFNKEEGLGLRLSHPDPHKSGVSTPAHERLKAEQNARELAESKRIFYVAATRARDHLFLLGERAVQNCWRDWIEVAREELEEQGLINIIDANELIKKDQRLPLTAPLSPERVKEISAQASDESRLKILAQLQAVRPPDPTQVSVRRIVAPVTQLDDFQLCPRRYHFWHELNLEEFPNLRGNKPPVPDGLPIEEETGAKLDPLRRGTLAHQLLEEVDLSRYEDEGQGLINALLLDEGYDLEDEQLISVRDDVEALLGSPFGLGLRGLQPASIQREWPFILPIPAGQNMTLFVSGKLDLLLQESPGHYRVVDYKHTFRQDRTAEDYRFQLMAYSLAATRLLSAESVEAEIVFLRDREHSWHEGPMALKPSLEELEAFELQLGELGLALAQARLAANFAKSPQQHCVDVKCGYVWRCYPGFKGKI